MLPSFRHGGEGPKGRKSKELCSRPAQRRSGSRPGRQSTDSNPRIFCLLSLVHSMKLTKIRADRVPAPPREAGGSCFHARTHAAPKRLRRVHTARRLCALRQSLTLAYRFSSGRASDAFLSIPVQAQWPATARRCAAADLP